MCFSPFLLQQPALSAALSAGPPWAGSTCLGPARRPPASRGAHTASRPRSALLSACERAGDLDAALRLLEGMHAAGLQATQDAYVRLIERLGKRRDWGGALEVFLAMQMAGCEATRAPCLALLGAAEASGRAAPAVQLLEAYDAAGAAPDDDVLEAAVRVASAAAAEARAVWARLRAAPARPDPAAARMLHDACAGGGDAAGAEEIAADCKRLGVALPPAPPAPAPPAPRGA